MGLSVLVVTSAVGFGQLIQQSLQAAGQHRVQLAISGHEAIQQAQATVFELYILDADIQDAPLTDLSQSLRAANPAAHVILIPLEGEQCSPTESISDRCLSKPFYLPDLLTMMDEIALKPDLVPTSPPVTADPPAVEAQPAAGKHPPVSTPLARPRPALPWLEDVARAAQHLARLSLESAAQAAFIVRDGQLWAYAGQLPQPAAQEMARTLMSYWARGDGADLARFAHLDGNGSDHMLYATGLGGDMVLAMVFDVETPFSKIRSQAVQLARSLASPPAVETTSPPAPVKPTPAEKPPEKVKPLLEDVPPPRPARSHPGGSSAGARLPVKPLPLTVSPSIPEKRAPEPPQPLPAANPQFSLESSPAIRLETLSTAANNELSSEAAPPQADMLAETRPHLVEATGPNEYLQPISPAMIRLGYACLLIPRLPHHYLTGDLSVKLTEWIAQLCLAFGWRLEHLAIRPEYLQWVVNVSPNTSPGYLMRIVRQQTSQRIFADFPTLARENPSGDFWAPGYLIVGSSQPPGAPMVKEFIQQTRRYQGVQRLGNG